MDQNSSSVDYNNDATSNLIVNTSTKTCILGQNDTVDRNRKLKPKNTILILPSNVNLLNNENFKCRVKITLKKRSVLILIDKYNCKSVFTFFFQLTQLTHFEYSNFIF